MEDFVWCCRSLLWMLFALCVVCGHLSSQTTPVKLPSCRSQAWARPIPSGDRCGRRASPSVFPLRGNRAATLTIASTRHGGMPHEDRT